MKSSNILLILVFLILAALVGYMFWGGGQEKQRTFRNTLIDIDTASINTIRITPKGGSELTVWKEGETWKVKNDTFTGDADIEKVEQLIGELLLIKPKSLTSKSEATWKEYEVDDENAMRVLIEAEGQDKMELLVGKFNIQQPKNPQAAPANPYQQQAQMRPLSYVRIAGEKETYSVDGLLNMSLNRKPSDLIPPPPPPPPSDSLRLEQTDTSLTE